MIVLIVAVLLALVIAGIWNYRTTTLYTRPCPRCGHRVRQGVMECPACEFDFNRL